MRMLVAVLAGLALGFAARAATMQPAESASTTTCGSLTCTAHEECCVSPAPITYRCVARGTCPYNK
jgi:hypothetical protein